MRIILWGVIGFFKSSILSHHAERLKYCLNVILLIRIVWFSEPMQAMRTSFH